ncbi:uncharacterized protein LOC127087565 [Lathyrus oleraceus]|uniref:uncharacterized protein LOC127087565 n=1 Tax=Pisum sativum TaxID=3888 RepID=UPI0021D1076F|nr:uncharacterized protein LOC127087565 [Pisum sativum]
MFNEPISPPSLTPSSPSYYTISYDSDPQSPTLAQLQTRALFAQNQPEPETNIPSPSEKPPTPPSEPHIETLTENPITHQSEPLIEPITPSTPTSPTAEATEKAVAEATATAEVKAKAKVDAEEAARIAAEEASKDRDDALTQGEQSQSDFAPLVLKTLEELQKEQQVVRARLDQQDFVNFNIQNLLT